MSGKRLGLVIGNNYPGSENELKFAVADALQMKEVLLNNDICGFDQVEKSINEPCLEAKIKAEKIFSSAGANDLVFIYFSGHGKKLDFNNELCMLFNDTCEEALLATSLTFGFINEIRKYPQLRSAVIVLDCCYSGAADIRGDDLTDAFKYCSGIGTVLLTSTGKTGSMSAKEDKDLGHGVFTHFLLEGLETGSVATNNNGYISIDDLYKYARDKTTERCSQSPKMGGNIEGDIFIGKNPMKIIEIEYNEKKSKLIREYSGMLKAPITNVSLTILKNKYYEPSLLGPHDVTILSNLESLLNGEVSPENYTDIVCFWKGIGNGASDQKNSSPQSPQIEDYTEEKNDSLEIDEEYETSDIFTSKTTGMEFIKILDGDFMMGSNEYHNEIPVHKVKITKPFYLGRCPVTKKQWTKVMGSNPSHFEGNNNPVELVSWDDAQNFIKKLNQMESTDKYRLPSESEWEYACRADTTTIYYFGDDESKLGGYAWYSGNSGRRTHPVGMKKPNPWGFHDMNGNVWEWVQDIRHDDYDGASSDGSAWEDENSSRRVLRGGSWSNLARGCRSASRDYCLHDYRKDNLGFRVLKEI